MKFPTLNRLLFLCFFLILIISMIQVFSVKAGDMSFHPDVILDFFIPEVRQEKPSEKNKISSFMEKLITPREDRIEERVSPLNLIGACPPTQGDYQCPQDPQITIGNGYDVEVHEERKSFIEILRGDEEVESE